MTGPRPGPAGTDSVPASTLSMAGCRRVLHQRPSDQAGAFSTEAKAPCPDAASAWRRADRNARHCRCSTTSRTCHKTRSTDHQRHAAHTRHPGSARASGGASGSVPVPARSAAPAWALVSAAASGRHRTQARRPRIRRCIGKALRYRSCRRARQTDMRRRNCPCSAGNTGTSQSSRSRHCPAGPGAPRPLARPRQPLQSVPRHFSTFSTYTLPHNAVVP